MGYFGQSIGGAWRDEDYVCPASQLDVQNWIPYCIRPLMGNLSALRELD